MKTYLRNVLALIAACGITVCSWAVKLTEIVDMKALIGENPTLGPGVVKETGYSESDIVYSFTGAGAILELAHDALATKIANKDGNIVIAAWVKPTAAETMSIFSTGGQANGFKLDLTGSGVQCTLKDVSDYNGNFTIPRDGGTWTLVAVSFSLTGGENTGVIYATTTDGQKYTKSFGTRNDCNPNTFAIGSGNAGDLREGFKGKIANLKVFSSDAATMNNSDIAAVMGDAPALIEATTENANLTTADINTLYAGTRMDILNVPAGATITFTDALTCSKLVIATEGNVTLTAAEQPAATELAKLSFSQVAGVIKRTWFTATSFGVNFNSQNATDVSGALVADGAWAQTTGNNGSATVAGGLSTATWSCNNLWIEDSGANSYSDGSHTFIQGYLDDGNNGVNVKVTNIPYAKYDLYIYVETDTQNTTFTCKTVNGTAYTCGSTGIATEGTDAWGASGAHGDGVPVLGTNTMWIQGLQGSALELISTRPGGTGPRGCISAIQIVDTGSVKAWHPSTVGVNFTLDDGAMSDAGTDNYGFESGDKGGLLVESAWQNVKESSATTDKTVALSDAVNGSYTMVYRGGNDNANGIYGPSNAAGNKLLDSYIDNGSTIEISGLPTSGYDVALIFSGDGGNFSRVTVNGVNKIYTGSGTEDSPYVLADGNAKWGDRSTPTTETALVEGKNVMYLAGLMTSQLRLQTYNDGSDGGRGTIAAIQIFVKRGQTELPVTRVLNAGENSWAEDGAWSEATIRNPKGTTTLSATDAATVNMNEAGTVKELFVNGPGTVTFAGENRLTSPVTFVNTDLVAANASLGAVTLASGKSLTVDVIDSITMNANSSLRFEGPTTLTQASPDAWVPNNFAVTFAKKVTSTDMLLSNGRTANIVEGADIEVTNMLRTSDKNGGSTINQSGGVLTCSGSANGDYKEGAFVLSHWPVETTYNLTGGTLNVPNSAAKLGADGTGNLNVSGGIANLHSLSLNKGTLTLSASGKLNIGAANVNAAISYVNGNFAFHGGEFGPWAKTELALTKAMTIKGGTVIRTSTAEETPRAATLTFSGNLTSGASDGGFVVDGIGTMKLTAANGGVEAPITVKSGATLEYAGTENIPFTKGTITNNGTVTIYGGEGSMLPPMEGSGKLNINNSVNLCGPVSSTGTLTVADGATLTFAAHDDFGTGDNAETPGINGGSIALGTGATVAMGDFASVTIASDKSLSGAGTLSGGVTFADGAIVDTRTGMPTVGTATFAGALKILVASDYELPAGGVTFLAYTSKSGDPTVTVKRVDADGQESDVPAAWILTVGETGISVALDETEKEISADTTLNALALTSLTGDDDLVLNVTADATLTLDSTDVHVNGVIITGSGTLTIVAEEGSLSAVSSVKLETNVIATPDVFDCASIEIASEKVLTLNGPTGETDAALTLGASAITGAGSVVINEGKVKFADVAIGVPVTTRAATTEPAKAIGTLYLANTAEETLTIAQKVTNNGVLVTDGAITLASFSMSNALTVQTGTLTITGGSESIYGDITIESPATLKAGANYMCSISNNNYPRFVVKGTLDMATSLWTIAGDTSFKMYSGAEVTATTGTLQFNGGTVSVLQEGTSVEPIDYGAIFKLNGNTTIDVASGLTLNIAGVVSQDGASQFKVTGTGTVVLAAVNTYSGGTDIAAGATVKITHKDALGAASATNKITGAQGAVLEISGNYSAANEAEPLTNRTGLTDGETWKGTVRFSTTGRKAKLRIAEECGNANSEIEYAGATGYFFKTGFATITIPCPVRLTGEGLQMADGSSGDSSNQKIVITELLGTGKLKGPANDDWNYAILLQNVADFDGSMDLTAGSHGSRFSVLIGADFPANYTFNGYKTHITILEGATATIAEGQTWKPATGSSGKVRVYGALAGPGKVDGDLVFGETGVVDATANSLELTGTISSGTLRIRVASDVADNTLVLKKAGMTLPTRFVVSEGDSTTPSATRTLTTVDDGVAVTTSSMKILVDGQVYPTINAAIAAANAAGVPLTVTAVESDNYVLDALDLSSGVKLAFAEDATLTVTGTLTLGTNRDFMVKDATTTPVTYWDKSKLVVGNGTGTVTVNIVESNNEETPINVTWTWADTTKTTVKITPLNYKVDDTKYPILTTGEGGAVTIGADNNINFPTSLTGQGAWYEWLFEGDIADTGRANSGNIDHATTNDVVAEDYVTVDNTNPARKAVKITEDIYKTVDYGSVKNDVSNPDGVWSASFFGKVPNNKGGILIGFGNTNDGSKGTIALVHGDPADDDDLVYLVYVPYNGSDMPYSILGTMKVPYATTTYHLYTFVKYKDTVQIYRDDKPLTRVPCSYEIGSGLQIGRLFGGKNADTARFTKDGITLTNAVEGATNTPAVDMLRIYDCELTIDEAKRLAVEYAYVSEEGTYTRTINADANWVETTAWNLVKLVDNSVVETDEDEPAGGNVSLQATGASEMKVTMNTTAVHNFVDMTFTGSAPIKVVAAETINHLTVKGYTAIETSVNLDCATMTLEGAVGVSSGKTLTLTITDTFLKKMIADAEEKNASISHALTGSVTCQTDANGENPGQVKSVIPATIPQGWTCAITKNEADNSYTVTVAHEPWKVTVNGEMVTWTVGESTTAVEAPTQLLGLPVTVTVEADGELALPAAVPALTVQGAGKTVTLTGTSAIAALTVEDGASVALSDTTTVTAKPTLTATATLTLGTGGTLTSLPLNLNTCLPESGTVALHYNGAVALASALDNSEATGDVDCNVTIKSGTTLELQALGGYYNGTFTVEEGAVLKSTKDGAAIPFGKWNTKIVNYGKVYVAGTGTNRLPTIEGYGTVYIDESATLCAPLTLTAQKPDQTYASGVVVIATDKVLTLASGGDDFPNATPSIDKTSVVLNGEIVTATYSMTIASGRSLSGGGTVIGGVTFANGAVLVPSTVEVTGDITWPTATDASVTVTVDTAPDAGESISVLKGAKVSIPAAYTISVGGATSTELVLSVQQDDTLVVTRKPVMDSTEGGPITRPEGGATEGNAGTITVTVPTTPTEEGDVASATQVTSVTKAVEDALVAAAAAQNVVKITEVKVAPLGGAVASDAVATTVAEGMSAAEVFTDIVTVTPNKDDATTGSAVISYAFGVERMTIATSGDKKYVVLLAHVRNAAYGATSTADFHAQATLSSANMEKYPHDSDHGLSLETLWDGAYNNKPGYEIIAIPFTRFTLPTGAGGKSHQLQIKVTR